jgi:hypothetical protein
VTALRSAGASSFSSSAVSPEMNRICIVSWGSRATSSFAIDVPLALNRR